MDPIYLDHNATTAIDPLVLETMLPYFREIFGNASSIHAFGQAAKKGVDEAREIVAGHLGCRPREVVFTSGATEADNHALVGVFEALKKQGTPHRRERHRASGGAGHGQTAGNGGRGGDARVARCDGHGAARGRRGGASRRHDFGVDHVRQQRNRRGAADRRNRQGRQGPGDSVPHRRGAGGGQMAAERGRVGRGFDESVGAQDLRAQGDRRAVLSGAGRLSAR